VPRARRRLRPDRSVAAGAILDHHRLTPVLAHLLADEARDDVGRPARWERHDHADRAIGIGLRVIDAALRDRSSTVSATAKAAAKMRNARAMTRHHGKDQSIFIPIA
jgi:hypothetical protein